MNGKKMVKSNIGEVEIIGFFDLNKEPIKEIMNIIKNEEVIKNQNYPPSFWNINVIKATRLPKPSPEPNDPNPSPEPIGNIVPIIIPGTPEISKYL